MHTITLITFKGCQPTIDFRDEVEALIAGGAIDARIDLLIVPAPKDAARFGLCGSPTILLDGVEYQTDRRGPPGFY